MIGGSIAHRIDREARIHHGNRGSSPLAGEPAGPVMLRRPELPLVT